MPKKTLILIPAKGKSRRLENKNIRTLNGVSLVELAVTRSLSCNKGDVVVSTEDKVIMNLVKSYPITIIERPKKLAGDSVRVIEVVLHVLDKIGYLFDTFIMTLPTSPLCKVVDMCCALDLFVDGKRNPDRMPVMSVTRMEGNPWLIGRCHEEHREVLVPMFTSSWVAQDITMQSRQTPLKCNGAVYVCDVKMFQDKKEFYIDGMLVYEMPRDRGLDVDTEMDLMLVEKILERQGL